MEQAREWLFEWFRGRRKIGKLKPEELLHRNFLDARMLTSMEIVELVTDIENKFGIQFSEEDLQDQRLVTVSGLSDLIGERVSQQHAGSRRATGSVQHGGLL